VAKRIQLALINLDKSGAGRRVITNRKKKLTRTRDRGRQRV